MERNAHLSIQNDIVVKADKLANDLALEMKCTGVFVSLANTGQLFSIGVSETEMSKAGVRIHDIKDSVCGVTVSENKPISLTDARATIETSEIPYVTAGHIVGYIGHPIRDRQSVAIGAICAYSDTPRNWSKVDELMLKKSSLEVEYLIANAVSDIEGSALSQSLAEYDRILGSIAVHADIKVSIHNNKGDLLFASNALLAQIDSSFIEAQVRKRLKFQPHGSNERGLAALDNSTASDAILSQPSRQPFTKWIAHVQECSHDTLFVSWDAK